MICLPSACLSVCLSSYLECFEHTCIYAVYQWLYHIKCWYELFLIMQMFISHSSSNTGLFFGKCFIYQELNP